MSDQLTAKQAKALALLRINAAGLTVNELCQRNRELPEVMRPRLHSLRHRGLAKHDGMRPARWRAT